MSKVDGWTEGRYNSFITSTLRGGMRRWPPKWQCLKEAYVGKKIGKSGRLGAHYKCAMCEGEFPSASIEIDHTMPVVDPSVGFVNWDTYIDRLFCSKENLKALCKPCHKIKTATEKKSRTSLVEKRAKKPRSTSSSKTSSTTARTRSGAVSSKKKSASR